MNPRTGLTNYDVVWLYIKNGPYIAFKAFKLFMWFSMGV